MRSPRTIALLWVLVVAFTTWGMPRPDDDQLSIRDPDSFGDWFEPPSEVAPLYRTLPAVEAESVRSWALAPGAGRVVIEFVGGDGNLHRLQPRVTGALSLDARNLDLTRGVLEGEFTQPLAAWPTRFGIQVLGGSIGTAPRSIGSTAVGPMQLRVAMNERSIDLEGEFTVTRVAEDRITVSADQLDGLDLSALELEGALPDLAKRFGAQWLESTPTIRLRVVLQAG